jgi:hypothetical protein
MILFLGIEIFSIKPEEQVSLILWVIRHLDAFYSSELPWLSGRKEKDNSNLAEGVSQEWLIGMAPKAAIQNARRHLAK